MIFTIQKNFQTLLFNLIQFSLFILKIIKFGIRVHQAQILLQQSAKTSQICNLIDIGGNQIGNQGALGLGSALKNCTNLSNLSLNLSCNLVGAIGVSGLASALSNCTNISNLSIDLRWNLIYDEGASGLGCALPNYTNLSNLSLGIVCNKMTKQGASILYSGLAKCINLSNLSLEIGQKLFIFFYVLIFLQLFTLIYFGI
ncbi:hypothetical protein TTHERM_000713219 (macronuclear) [Tetrahymena thermophila SB210]|uniref:Transmembrane protein n=1 Tax=Tetrahymena thermophila (strain SB210) TaxID=312017 RepID=W7XCI7_TETTS|nr:hypothetical protein TTHERM_000713219 [Tetrahymena thermophila SB210]EWS71481.1 hypothetical protein TTHERM_000713219 [Tetrahymena thermophila SB210]|eukprot:XP_012655984.1 hypothetical protein TTHERM_000713219 [Tetrahymena thermophila SB210]